MRGNQIGFLGRFVRRLLRLFVAKHLEFELKKQFFSVKFGVLAFAPGGFSDRALLRSISSEKKLSEMRKNSSEIRHRHVQ